MNMFVFGIDVPIAELLLLTLLLVIVSLIALIAQLVRMAKHIRVLDETTLEIRRYEQEEDVVIRALTIRPAALESDRRRFLLQKYLPSLGRLERAAAKRLLEGEEPSVVRDRLVDSGASDAAATRVINDAIAHLTRYAALGAREAAERTRQNLKAARKG
jgi:hypothetical protein